MMMMVSTVGSSVANPVMKARVKLPRGFEAVFAMEAFSSSDEGSSAFRLWRSREIILLKISSWDKFCRLSGVLR